MKMHLMNGLLKLMMMTAMRITVRHESKKNILSFGKESHSFNLGNFKV